MEEFSFQALGTTWSIGIDGGELQPNQKQEVLALISDFENKFSRFIGGSEVNRFRSAKSGEYHISPEFTNMLKTASILREYTDGIYDPAVAILLEHAGYNAVYNLAPNDQIEQYEMAAWSLQGNILSISGPIAFDLGGIGKGYCIDKVVELLKKQSYQHFLVEAGGDMYATEKQDGSAFQIALEWPGKPGIAYGTLTLKHAGFAASDTSRRRWKDWHHIINPITKTPIQKIIGCAAVAPNAFFADCMTSGVFLSDQKNFSKLAREFMSEYVFFTENESIQTSKSWPGELFY